MEQTVNFRSQDFDVLCVCIVRMPRVEYPIGCWVSKIANQSNLKLTVFDAKLYPVLMKSPKSCLNFLHNLSSVCDKRFLLICLKRLGPKRKGRSELC